MTDFLPCTHEEADKDTALADGMCPLCLAAEVERLTAELARFRHICLKCGEVFYGSGVMCIDCA